MKLKNIVRIGLALLLLPLLSEGQTPPVAVDSTAYYKIGGAKSITAAPNPKSKFKTIRASAELGIGYSCGKFDKTFGVARAINQIKRTGDALVDGAVGVVTSAISSLPMLILQRVSPGLYDLFQSLLLRAEAVIQIADASCQEYESRISKGENPLNDFAQLAKIFDWKAQMGTEGFSLSNVDVATAKENVERSNGANGLPWICGKNSGGKGQDPIRITFDTVVAGYNITLDRSSCEKSKPDNDPEDTPLVGIWETPEDAGTWAVEVLGEIVIRTYDDRPTDATPGYGLLRKIPDEVKSVQEVLNDLVASDQIPDLEQLAQIGTDGTLITVDLIRALRDLEAQDRSVAIGKLAEEIAMIRVLEQAVTLRRLMLTGKREPNIAASQAPKYIDESLAALEKEIDGLLFEKRIRKELVASTSTVILELREQSGTRADATRDRLDEDGKRLRGGSIPGETPDP